MIVRATSSLNTERNLADLPESWGGRVHEPYEGGLRERQIEIAVPLFETMSFPDERFSANAVVLQRKSVEDAAVFGFED